MDAVIADPEPAYIECERTDSTRGITFDIMVYNTPCVAHMVANGRAGMPRLPRWAR